MRIDGFVDPVAGHTLTLALEAVTPRPAVGDERSADQRRADALIDLAAGSLDAGETKADALVRPHLSLLITERTWTAVRRRRAAMTAAPCTEPAATEDGVLVPPSVLEQLACDCELTQIVLDAAGAPLDVGRAQRSFSRQVRRAVIARDRHCRWPGCDRPARWCEVHHIIFWSRGGATSVDNGITLCSFHHHEVHRSTATISVIPGGHRFTTPEGHPLGDSLRAQAQAQAQGQAQAQAQGQADAQGQAQVSAGSLAARAGALSARATPGGGSRTVAPQGDLPTVWAQSQERCCSAERSGGGRLGGGHPSGGRPNGGRPSGGRPNGGRPSGGRPSGGRPNDQGRGLGTTCRDHRSRPRCGTSTAVVR